MHADLLMPVMRTMMATWTPGYIHRIVRNDIEKKRGLLSSTLLSPIHKKGDKQLLPNNLPVSVLPKFSKIFARIIFNSIFEYLEGNSLLCPSQSGFHPLDSCEAMKKWLCVWWTYVKTAIHNTFYLP